MIKTQTTELPTAYAYYYPEGEWEVVYSDTPWDMPDCIQAQDFTEFLKLVLLGNDPKVDDVVIMPYGSAPINSERE